jgi:heme-degrading monooxygenase HmoA
MILFQIYFEVADEKCGEFEKAYAEVFEPALRRQPGFLESKLLRVYPAARIAEIEGAPTEHNYQFNFVFDTEESRRRWAVCKDHDVAWSKVSAIARRAVWRGYDLVGPAKS